GVLHLGAQLVDLERQLRHGGGFPDLDEGRREEKSEDQEPVHAFAPSPPCRLCRDGSVSHLHAAFLLTAARRRALRALGFFATSRGAGGGGRGVRRPQASLATAPRRVSRRDSLGPRNSALTRRSSSE